MEVLRYVYDSISIVVVVGQSLLRVIRWVAGIGFHPFVCCPRGVWEIFLVPAMVRGNHSSLLHPIPFFFFCDVC